MWGCWARGAAGGGPDRQRVERYPDARLHPAAGGAVVARRERCGAAGREGLLGVGQTDSELSDILMRAFILRRVELLSRGVSDVVLLGARRCWGWSRPTAS